MKLQVLLEKGHWLAVGVSVVAAVGHAVQSAVGDAVGICSGVPNGSAVGPVKLVNEVGVPVDEVGVSVDKVGATIDDKVGTAAVGKLQKRCQNIGFGIYYNMFHSILWNYHPLTSECNSHMSV